MPYVSMKTIAAQAGVSVVAVSRALRDQPGVSQALAHKIKTIAQELGYRTPALLHEAMGQLRMQLPNRFDSQVAVCTDFADWEWDRIWSGQWSALQKPAMDLGYGLELFLSHTLSRKTLRAALRARNIRGILLILREPLAIDLEFLLEEFACVFLGHARRLELPVHFAAADEFQAAKKAMQEVLAREYRRIGLVRYHVLDPEGLYRAGIHSMISETVSITSLEKDSMRPLEKNRFLDWFRAEKPDCILTLQSEVWEWLVEAGYRIPEDVGLAHLRLSSQDGRGLSGVDPRENDINAAGLNKLVSMLRKGQSGIPAVQECTLIEGVWSEGVTLRPVRKQLVYGLEPPKLNSCREGSARLKCVDLRPHVNRSLTLAGGWFELMPLQYCPPGAHQICGTRFRILDEAADGKAALIMGSQRCPGAGDPNPVQVDIKIGCRIKSVHFLHACGWSGGPVRNFASYHLIDAQGNRRTLPLIDRRTLSGPESDGNIQDYWPSLLPLTAPNVRPIHLTSYGNSELYSAYLYILEWINPNPRKLIQSIRITSDPAAQTTLGVLAVTVQL